LLVIILISVTTLAFSQDFSLEYGIINRDELNLTVYENDPDAEAVVLFDIGETKFVDTQSGGYDISFTRTKRIKIFDKSVSDIAEVSIPYYVDGYGKTEVIKSIEAFTYNVEDGGVVRKRVNPSSMYDEQFNDRWRIKKFVFPDIQDGSIIEYKYVLESPFHFNLPDWEFQDIIPTIYSKYTSRMIPFYEYIFIAQGITKFDYQKSEISKENRTWGSVSKMYGQNVGNGVEFQDYVHTYILKDVPAFKDESYITTKNDYIMKMDFQLAKFYGPNGAKTSIITTWPELNKSLIKNEYFGKFKKSCGKFAKKVLQNELSIADLSEEEKAKAIVNYVKQNFKWNGYYSKYVNKSAKEFFEQKNGNSAEINLFLTEMLESAGLVAQPVVLSTRDHGRIVSDYPFSHFFNYVLVFVRTQRPFLADGTNKYLPYNKIPPYCINEKGLIVDGGSGNWVELSDAVTSKEVRNIIIKPDVKKLKADVSLSVHSTEYDAFNYKESFKDDSVSILKYYSKKFDDITRVKSFNYDLPDRPYSIIINANKDLENVSDNIIIQPFLGLALEKNSLTQKNRSYPVDFVYKKSDEFKITVEKPSGYQFDQLPEPYSLDDELVNIDIQYEEKDKMVLITANYTFKKAVYNKNEYPRIKYYLDMIVRKFNESLVLKPI
ncbi:DUF3857 domain-containing protein, partial [Fulvivirga lutimaris]|uniref:DUF3857 domain-containing protein n=1 Tax=Fulvivirga lutimaris TaxID=1819566 RepID=UPI001C8739E8